MACYTMKYEIVLVACRMHEEVGGIVWVDEFEGGDALGSGPAAAGW